MAQRYNALPREISEKSIPTTPILCYTITRRTSIMRRKDIGFRRLVVPTLTAIVLAMAMTGCSPTDDEVVKMLQNTTQVEVMVPVTVNEDNIHDGNIIIPEWIELGDMTSYPELRAAFDETFDIGTIADDDGTTDKTGVLYTLNQSNSYYTNNSTLLNAFQNKTFREEYWNDDTVSKLIEASEVAYADTDKSNGMQAAINAYYGLLPDTEPNYFNADESVSRVGFMSMVFKAENPVQSLKKDEGFWKSSNKDELSIYAQYLDDKAFLQYKNGYDYNNSTAQGSMSKAEAVYLIVNQYFADQLKEVDLSTAKVTYTDIINGGDLAIKRGFTKEAKETRGNIGYLKGYVLNYMFEIGEVDEDIYKAYVVASDLGLLPDTEKCNWNSTITKKETIELILRTYEIYGEQTGVSEGTGKLPATATVANENETGNAASDDAAIETPEDAEYQEQVYDEIHEEAVEAGEVPEVTDDLLSRINTLDKTMYAIQNVNLREGDSAEYNKAGSLTKAQTVHVTGQSTTTKWYQLEKEDGTKVYVSHNYLSDTKPSSNTASKPATPATPATPAPSTPVVPPISDDEFGGAESGTGGTQGGLGSGGSGEFAGVILQ